LEKPFSCQTIKEKLRIKNYGACQPKGIEMNQQGSNKLGAVNKKGVVDCT
jgi:hypothetical protein